jgi:hypothetical protein
MVLVVELVEQVALAEVVVEVLVQTLLHLLLVEQVAMVPSLFITNS